MIYFTDSEWNGGNFLNGEQLIEWIVPAGGIPAGTVLTMDMTPGGGAVITETGALDGAVSGSIDYIQGGGQLASSNEMMWAFQGTRIGDDVTPDNFIAVIGNEADGGNRATPNLDNTGLTTDTGAIIIDGDHDYMVFSGFDALPDPLSQEGGIAAISDLSNWTLAGAGNNGTDDNPNPQDGFDLQSPSFFDADDVTTLYFSGENVAFISDVSSPDGNVTAVLSVSDQPFLATDIIEIDILNSSLRPDGEFDFNEVIFTRVTVIRDGIAYDFVVNDGSKIKESGASNSDPGQAVEQGDTFFVTNDDVNSFIAAPVGISPFGGLPSGRMAFALNEIFVDAQGASIIREQPVTDENGDPVGTENANFYYGNNLTPDPVPCFAAGTLILTPRGHVPIETLEPGDLVLTRDAGPRPIRWIGGRRVPAAGPYAPIRIAAGTHGARRDLYLSPNHRLLVRGWQAELLFGEEPVLVAAKHLVNDTTIRPAPHAGQVHYLHILLDRHEVLLANGAEAESLNPAFLQDWPESDPARQEIADLCPDLFQPAAPSARLRRSALRAYEGRILGQL